MRPGLLNLAWGPRAGLPELVLDRSVVLAQKRVPKTGYLKAVWPDFLGSVFGVWAAPGGFKTIQKCGGLRRMQWVIWPTDATREALHARSVRQRLGRSGNREGYSRGGWGRRRRRRWATPCRNFDSLPPWWGTGRGLGQDLGLVLVFGA